MPKSKLIDVVLEDGPCKDKVVEYLHPLPGTMVVFGGGRWHDYRRTGKYRHYKHSPMCRCKTTGLDAYKL